MRLVVTGHDPQGRGAVVQDSTVEPILLPSGTMLHPLWGRDDAPTFPDEGTASSARGPFPPVGGFRFSLFTVPAGYRSEAHATATVDCGMVISGELWLELDDGAGHCLRPGEAFVQNGTRHAWWNRGTEPAVVALFIAGAHHAAFD